MIKQKESRYKGLFDNEDLKTKVSRWLGMICLAIGSGDVRTAIFNIYDEINDLAYVRGYNAAIDDMNRKQQELPGTK
jgi:hypothetical protein